MSNTPTPELKSAIGKSFPEDLADFYANQSSTLISQYQHVEKLIGLSKHSPSEGALCEALLRQYLRDILPRQYSVDTGFIRGIPTPAENKKGKSVLTVSSPQIDILIHDSMSFAPIYRFGDVVVVLPESVVAVIEVKKRLTSSTLKDALDNVLRTRWVLNQNSRHLAVDKVCFGIFAFSTTIAKPKGANISAAYSNHYKSFVADAVDPHLLPDVLATLGGVSIFRDDSTDFNKPAICRCYKSRVNNRDYALQILLTVLMEKMETAERLSRVKRFAFPDKLELLSQETFHAGVSPSQQSTTTDPKSAAMSTPSIISSPPKY